MADDIKSFRILLDYIDKIMEKEGNEKFREEFSVRYGCKSYDQLVRVQRARLLERGRKFYASVASAKLKGDLARDYAEMMWYMNIGAIPQMFSHLNFQIENMLNYYVSKTDAYSKIASTPSKYEYHWTNNKGTSRWDILCSGKFFLTKDGQIQRDKGGVLKKIEQRNIDLWGKYAYWFADCGEAKLAAQSRIPGYFKDKCHTIVTDATNFRNSLMHKNSVKGDDQSALKREASLTKQTRYWMDTIDAGYEIIRQFLEIIVGTIKSI